MKRIIYLLFVIFFAITNYISAQSEEIILFDFEEEPNIIFHDTISNIWQIGKPNKTIFNQSKSGENVIVTDTIEPYPTNSKSSFSFTLKKSEFQWYCTIYLSFNHYFEIDTIGDSAYVDFSFDGGVTWFLGADNDLNLPHSQHMRYYESSSMTQEVFDPIISGSSGGWAFEEYFWTFYVAVKKGFQEPIIPDSIIFRFNFVSDSIQSNHEGWMIDDIKVEGWKCSKVIEMDSGTFDLYPNPANSTLTVKYLKNIKSVSIIDVYGNVLIVEQNINKRDAIIELGNLKTGIYLVTLEDYSGSVITSKLIKY